MTKLRKERPAAAPSAAERQPPVGVCIPTEYGEHMTRDAPL
jgi:hypothetical protein